MCAELALRVEGGAQGVGRFRESDEERIAFGSDLVTVVTFGGATNDRAVRLEKMAVPVTGGAQETCRPFDVSEEERHRSARKVPHLERECRTELEVFRQWRPSVAKTNA
jgi:hypothetical protein